MSVISSIEERSFTISPDGRSEQLSNIRTIQGCSDGSMQDIAHDAAGTHRLHSPADAIQIDGLHYGSRPFDRYDVQTDERGNITHIELFRNDLPVSNLTCAYDARGLRTSTVHRIPDEGEPDRTVMTTFAYDGEDHLVERVTSFESMVVDRVRYSYDAAGLLTGEVSEDESGHRVETVFRYIVNEHGDWTERTAFRRIGTEERPIARIVRTITYAS